MFERLKYFFINNKKILLIVAGVLLIAIIVFFSIPRGTKEKAALAPESAIPGNELAQSVATAPVEPTPEQKSESNALAVASSFAEIFGTYSNQSNYANIENVLPIASSRYKEDLSLFLSNLRVSYTPGTAYEGTTTIIVNKTAEDMNYAAGTAVVMVQTQRKISQGTQSNYTIKYQGLRLDLVREGDNWLVDNAKWIQ